MRKTAPKKYPTILGNVSKDKSPSIQYYFAKHPCFVFSPSLPLSFPELTRHFSYSQTESVDSEVKVILNLLSLAWELHIRGLSTRSNRLSRPGKPNGLGYKREDV